MRMVHWLIVALAVAGLVYLIAPAQLEVAAWKALLVTGAAWLGYRLDRDLFPYARPHDAVEAALRAYQVAIGDPKETAPALLALAAGLAAGASMLRRAIVIAAATLAAGLGL